MSDEDRVRKINAYRMMLVEHCLLGMPICLVSLQYYLDRIKQLVLTRGMDE